MPYLWEIPWFLPKVQYVSYLFEKICSPGGHPGSYQVQLVVFEE